MNPKDLLARPWLRGGMCAGLAAALTISVSTIALAQEEAEEAPAAVEEAEAEDAADDTIVVTGSRIRRDEFSSASPLQIVDGEMARSIGLVDTASMITQATVAAGTQLDATFSGGTGTAVLEDVPVNGLGGATVQLRGLEPERTLVLLNGRRLPPAGVRGAPTQPDLNLLPSSMIERVEILTDGASSVYGADAVAGVVNIITRSNFDGAEFTAFYGQPEAGGGTVEQYSGIIGSTFERGQITFAAEFFERSRVAVGDREFSRCNRDFERDPANPGVVIEGPCSDGLPDNAAAGLGGQTGLPTFIFYVPGQFATSTGVPEFEREANLPPPFPGAPPVRFSDYNDFYNLQDERRQADLIQPLRRVSVYASGDFDINWWKSDELFFEFLYSDRQQRLRAADEQIFPGVPALIPQVQDLDDGNPANGDELDGFVRNPDGSIALFENPLSPFAALATQRTNTRRALNPLDPLFLAPFNYNQIIGFTVFTSPDFNQIRNVEVDQYRGVLGMRGDIDLSYDSGGILNLRNWTYEISGSYSRSQGFASQIGMNEPLVQLIMDSMRLNEDGTEVVCGPMPGNTGGLDFGFLAGSAPCVPVDFFGALATKSFTDEEKNYILGLRTNRTVIEQAIFTSYLTGDVLDLPAGVMPFVVGFEFRDDKINSQNDFLTTNFQLASESANEEGNTIGSTSLMEVFFETEIPLVKGKLFMEEFTVNAAARWTEEENFGAKWTWRFQGLYAPADWLSFRGTLGTSFRAPNLREQFLADAIRSESNNLDPCKVPADAIIIVGGVPTYDPSGETRSPTTLDNCAADGFDPTQVGIGATQNFSVLDGGTQDLEAETSTSWTVGAVFRQPWFDSFELELAATWFDIDITNTVESIDAADILNRCYNLENRDLSACARITRTDSPNPQLQVVQQVVAGFINIGTLTAQGLDLNLRFSTDLRFDDEVVTVAVTSANSFMNEQLIQVDDLSPVQDNVGLIGTPEWQGVHNLIVNWRDFSFFWRSRFIGGTSAEGFVNSGNSDLDPGAIDGDPTTDPSWINHGIVDPIWYHDLSLGYEHRGGWVLRIGINNVFDTDPPLVDTDINGSTLPGQIFSNRNSVVTAGGFDFFGRTWFGSLTKKF